MNINAMSLRKRLILLLVLAVAGMLAIVASAVWQANNAMLQDREVKTRNLVESATSLVANIAKQVDNGTLTEAQGKKLAMEEIGAMRYDVDGYFWINDLTPTMVMLPLKPDLDGKNLSSTADPNGKKLFVEMAQVARTQGEGFVSYVWPKGSNKTPTPKISFVKLYKPWGWVIGTGIYIDDVHAATMHYTLALLTIVAIIIAMSTVLNILIQRSIYNPLKIFSNDLTETARKVGNALQESATATGSLAAATEETSAQSRIIRQNAQDADTQVAQVHSALEELNISIRDISSNVQSVNDFVRQAVDRSHETSQVVEELTQSTQRISEVLTLITSLAEQTNLLALNAAIEAARAGEAGRGFAVVADEVKKLATNTTNATGEIGGNINDIKRVAADCVSALNEVIDSIGKIQDNTNAMSAAVEEQSSVVTNVTENMRNTTERVTAVTSNLQGIEQAVNDSSVSTQELSQTSQNITKLFQELQQNAENTFTSLGLKQS